LASESLPADRVLTAGDISLVEMTTEQIRERFKGQDLTLIMMLDKNIIGRRLREPLKQGQPFLTTSLYLEGTGPSLAGRLRSGFRAVSVLVSETHGGNVEPGSYVDVVFRAQPRPGRLGEASIPEMTMPLLRRVEVLEADRSKTAGMGADAKTLVTLAIPAQKAEVLAVVEGRGELWLVATSLKETDGIAATAGPRLTLENVLEIPLPEPPVQTAIFRRGQVQVNTFVGGRLVSQSGTLWPGPSGGCTTCGKDGAASAPVPTPAPPAPGNVEGSSTPSGQAAVAEKHT